MSPASCLHLETVARSTLDDAGHMLNGLRICDCRRRNVYVQIVPFDVREEKQRLVIEGHQITISSHGTGETFLNSAAVSVAHFDFERC